MILIMKVQTNSKGAPDFSTAVTIEDVTKTINEVEVDAFGDGYNQGWEEGYEAGMRGL